jgi:hypothetical protein
LWQSVTLACSAVRPLFLEAHRGERLIVTSAITLLEVLVVPFRDGSSSPPHVARVAGRS